MPEDPGGEKTLPASGKKKQEARSEGNVAKSQDLTSAWSLMSALIALRLLGPIMLRRLVDTFGFYFSEIDVLIPPGTKNLQPLVGRVVMQIISCVLPLMTVMVLAGLTINLFQVGFLYSPKALQPKLSKLNPITGFSKFVSIRTLVEFVKSMIKLAIVTVIVWTVVRDKLNFILALMHADPLTVVGAVGSLIISVWTRIVIAMFILGILDYAFQKWKYEKDLMMTVKEARDEAKEVEGDPRIKQRIKRVQRQLAMQRMMKGVPTADVIITNPTTYAVALKYDLEKALAPIVIAKGARLIAEKIRDIGIENDVPIVEKPELARTLYRTIEVGQAIPEKLFKAVAEVLAFVYEIDRRKEKIDQRQKMMTAQSAV